MTTLMTALFDDFDHHPIPADILHRWAARYPALAASTTDLVTDAACWHHARADAVLIPLHALAVAVLVALAPRLAAVARRQRNDRVEIVDELNGYLFEAAVTPTPAGRPATATSWCAPPCEPARPDPSIGSRSCPCSPMSPNPAIRSKCLPCPRRTM